MAIISCSSLPGGFDEGKEASMKAMKIGLQLGYWGSGPPPNAVELVQEADRLGL